MDVNRGVRNRFASTKKGSERKHTEKERGRQKEDSDSEACDEVEESYPQTTTGTSLARPALKKRLAEAQGEGQKFMLLPGTYWLTRICLLRFLVAIYFVAFLVAFNQNRALLGKNGLLPADKYLKEVRTHVGGTLWERFKAAPTLLWMCDYVTNIDVLLDRLAVAGMLISLFVLMMGSSNIPLMLLLWLLYHSIVNVGQRWYSFGWESQLLETGFLAAFMCPLFSLSRVPRDTPTPSVALWGYRWLIFRIMLGAGLIKIRGDQCWRDLTCMHYHYQTQPVPNPMSYFMHQEPSTMHKFETLANHFAELVAPWLLLMGRRLCIVGGIIQIAFMGTIIISGNLSFLNHLTMLPSIACFDDRSLAWLFSNSPGGVKHQVWRIQQGDIKGDTRHKSFGYYFRRVVNVWLGLTLAYLSLPIVQNLVSSRQIMNTSFDSFRIVNTYGAFGSITKERTEVIFQGTYDSNPNDPNAKWLEYEFKCKPGSIDRCPCLISPYHYRLDWLMWFAAFQNYQYNDWLVHLAAKFLVNDEGATSLIAHNPFMGKDPPKFVRAEHYRYQFTKIGSKDAQKGRWWKRQRIGNYMPAVSLDSLQDFLSQKNWRVKKPKKSKATKKKKVPTATLR